MLAKCHGVLAMRMSSVRQKWTHAMPRDLIAPSAVVDADRPNDVIRQFNALKRLARQNGDIQRAARTVRREFPTDTRVINRQNQVYFAKWHYMKYCTQVIQYSMRKELRLRADIEEQGSIAQKQVLGNVPPPAWGSGRFSSEEWKKIEKRSAADGQLSQGGQISANSVRGFCDRGELERLLPPRAKP
ncbi:unnamed protein product [Symbiodinium sp. CCMP2456]|nr:unnamed protein product [Symbiodinium sp. CCMP2456]